MSIAKRKLSNEPSFAVQSGGIHCKVNAVLHRNYTATATLILYIRGVFLSLLNLIIICKHYYL